MEERILSVSPVSGDRVTVFIEDLVENEVFTKEMIADVTTKKLFGPFASDFLLERLHGFENTALDIYQRRLALALFDRLHFAAKEPSVSTSSLLLDFAIFWFENRSFSPAFQWLSLELNFDLVEQWGSGLPAKLKSLLLCAAKSDVSLEFRTFGDRSRVLTPLHVAIRLGVYACSQIVLAEENRLYFQPFVCRATCQNLFWETPLYFAVGFGYYSVVQWMISTGVSLVCSDNDRETLLMKAFKARDDAAELAEILLKENSFRIPTLAFNPEARNRLGQTARDIGIPLGFDRTKHQRLAAYLHSPDPTSITGHFMAPLIKPASTFIRPKVGFEFNHTALEILDICKIDDEYFFRVSWVGSNEITLVPTKIANLKVPHLVIAFYESKIQVF